MQKTTRIKRKKEKKRMMKSEKNGSRDTRPTVDLTQSDWRPPTLLSYLLLTSRVLLHTVPESSEVDRPRGEGSVGFFSLTEGSVGPGGAKRGQEQK